MHIQHAHTMHIVACMHAMNIVACIHTMKIVACMHRHKQSSAMQAHRGQRAIGHHVTHRKEAREVLCANIASALWIISQPRRLEAEQRQRWQKRSENQYNQSLISQCARCVLARVVARNARHHAVLRLIPIREVVEDNHDEQIEANIRPDNEKGEEEEERPRGGAAVALAIVIEGLDAIGRLDCQIVHNAMPVLASGHAEKSKRAIEEVCVIECGSIGE